MESNTFNRIVETGQNRSTEILDRKELEYSEEGKDRLIQFKMAGGVQQTNPAQALVGMMTKHFTSLTMMVRKPGLYREKTWVDKLDDLRNYTHLLEGVLIDMNILNPIGGEE